MQTIKTKLLQRIDSNNFNVGLRAFSAIFVGYLLAATATGLLALALPLPPAESTLTATMLSFSVYACAGIWAFSVSNQWRALIDPLCLSGVFYLLILAIG
ncbi:hypothetical protein [Shewanella sairae]|uniref:hypothetical protein n=1 Tax=Shewanella sairae TaxID=190310 RepID=UPI001C7FD2D1|nr:hypothetical protein [Shewanella sairae]MCL1130868.1 hypothetical protein [Shewanella sairae]